MGRGPSALTAQARRGSSSGWCPGRGRSTSGQEAGSMAGILTGLQAGGITTLTGQILEELVGANRITGRVMSLVWLYSTTSTMMAFHDVSCHHRKPIICES